MMSPRKSLGVMHPIGGGDPIPLKKDELVIGRRPTCDIRLDFENISGKHCILKFVRGTWHVRDLGSTNGTTVDGERISSEHGLLPDNELGIAGHYFRLDYDAAAPTSLMDANMMLEEEMSEAPRKRSLMELAGLENPDAFPRRPGGGPPQPPRPPEKAARPARPDPAAPEGTGLRDRDDLKPVAASDEDFFDMIKGDVEEDASKPKRRR